MVIKENQRVIEYRFHLLRVSNEIRGEITVAKLHAFDDFERGIGGSGFLYGNNAVLTDLVHCVGNHLADFCIAVGGNGTDLRDGFSCLNLN